MLESFISLRKPFILLGIELSLRDEITTPAGYVRRLYLDQKLWYNKAMTSRV